ncbi:MAG: hypothetical protein H7841_01195 [Magnetospirillum sp. WYHS-4]
MTHQLVFLSRRAFEVPAGQAAIRPGDGVVGMKLRQMAKDFVRHYLLPLEPLPAEGLKLVYLDPEDDLIDCGGPVRLSLGDARPPAADTRPAVFRNARGTFLAAEQAARAYTMSEAQRFYKAECFVDLASCEALSRQDRNISAVFPDWRVEGMGTADGIMPLERVLSAYQKSRSA